MIGAVGWVFGRGVWGTWRGFVVIVVLERSPFWDWDGRG